MGRNAHAATANDVPYITNFTEEKKEISRPFFVKVSLYSMTKREEKNFSKRFHCFGTFTVIPETSFFLVSYHL